MEKTKLSGGCYVLNGVWGADAPLTGLVGRAGGARHISQIGLETKGPSPILQFGRSEVVAFVIEGEGRARIGNRSFSFKPRSGLYIRPGEAFRLESKGAVRALLTVCPEEPSFRVMKTLPESFDKTCPERITNRDPARKEAMGERFFQVLVSKPLGSENVTQFIGEIPLSKAPAHHHLYEEAICVLSGEGFMWTGSKKAPVKPGSVIFLPKKQKHSLECTSKDGLTVAGHFYPAGSPAENY